jgi:hypothetical protein
LNRSALDQRPDVLEIFHEPQTALARSAARFVSERTEITLAHLGVPHPMTRIDPLQPPASSHERALEVRKAWLALLRLLAAEVHRRMTPAGSDLPAEPDSNAIARQ